MNSEETGEKMTHEKAKRGKEKQWGSNVVIKRLTKNF